MFKGKEQKIFKEKIQNFHQKRTRETKKRTNNHYFSDQLSAYKPQIKNDSYKGDLITAKYNCAVSYWFKTVEKRETK